MTTERTIKTVILEHANGLPIPQYATSGSCGIDLSAANDKDIEILAGESALIPTGLKFAIPFDMYAQVHPRSGLAAKFRVTVLNAPGTIDSDYRGEIFICLINHGKEPYIVKRGNRIAQILFLKRNAIALEIIDNLDETSRGSQGFGSTGGI